MQANPKSLWDLLRSAERFIIPEYQRPYCWTLEEVEQLVGDLSEAHREASAEDYFLGPVVVTMQRGKFGDVAAVVDGQQRMTTLHALLWCATHRLKRSGPGHEEMLKRLDQVLVTPTNATTLAVAQADQANFLALRENTPLDERRELGLAGVYLRKKFDEFESTDEVVDLLRYALHQTTFILVVTETYASAWDLFIGLNGKGRPLNAADLIKAFVCGSSGEENRVIPAIWQDKVLPLGADSTSALLEIVRVATGEVGSEAKLFKQFESAWRAGKITASLLSDGAMSYQVIWQTPVDDLPGLAPAGKRPLRGLRKLDRRDHTSLLLAMAACFGSHAAVDATLLAALESYQLWMAIRGKRGRERDFTALAATLYRDKPTLTAARKRVRELLERLAPASTRVDVVAAVGAAAYPGRIMKFIVSQHEEGLRGDVRIDDAQYEHIMPQTPTSFWFAAAGTQSPNEYARIINNIGNIAPLDQKTNIVGSNDDWPTKQALYAKEVPTWLVARLAVDHPVAWTPKAISDRARGIAEWAVTKRWDLPKALADLENE